ncbi:hypothetical protein BNJ_00256 [Kaumoebavirus]|uniref:hypothetical protein n=1 Tax=Kaumoebavirus TaxID=1859492 RepID=UPI0009C1BE57|nr:hypothetical protein BNJ_00256 [Kaumoebavirus]ARA72082.1 hypothetical protein BNJ_00256 [Kaumoebavirus]
MSTLPNELLSELFREIVNTHSFGSLNPFSLLCRYTAQLVHQNKDALVAHFIKTEYTKKIERIPCKYLSSKKGEVWRHTKYIPNKNRTLHGMQFWIAPVWTDVMYIAMHYGKEEAIGSVSFLKPDETYYTYENREVSMGVREKAGSIIYYRRKDPRYTIDYTPLLYSGIVIVNGRHMPVTPIILDQFMSDYIWLNNYVGEIPADITQMTL